MGGGLRGIIVYSRKIDGDYGSERAHAEVWETPRCSGRLETPGHVMKRGALFFLVGEERIAHPVVATETVAGSRAVLNKQTKTGQRRLFLIHGSLTHSFLLNHWSVAYARVT